MKVRLERLFRSSVRSIRRHFFCCLFNSSFISLYDRWFPQRKTGQQGELLACRYLLKKGFVIIESGYQDKRGEIDLIAVDDQTLVFIEVKTRRGSLEDPAEAVDLPKQKRISETAKRYTKRHQLTEQAIRFDVIAIQWGPQRQQPSIKHYEAAFSATANFQLY